MCCVICTNCFWILENFFWKEAIHDGLCFYAYECLEGRCERRIPSSSLWTLGMVFRRKLERNTFQCFSQSKVTKVVGLGVRAKINLVKRFYITIKIPFCDWNSSHKTRSAKIQLMSATISGRIYDDFIRLLFLHAHREASALDNAKKVVRILTFYDTLQEGLA